MATISDYIYVNTAANAQALSSLTVGQLVATGGYTAVGDGGGFLYRFSTTRSESLRKDELEVTGTGGGYLVPIDDLLVVDPLRWGVRPGPQTSTNKQHNIDRINEVIDYMLSIGSTERTTGFGGIIAFPAGRFELNIDLNELGSLRSLAIVGAGMGPTVLKNHYTSLDHPVIYRDRTTIDNCTISLQRLKVWAEGEVQGAAVRLASKGGSDGRVYGALRDLHVLHDSRKQPALEIYAGLKMVLQNVRTEGGGVGLLLEDSTACVVDDFHALDAAAGIWVWGGGSNTFTSPRVENDHGLGDYDRGEPYNDIMTFGLRITDSGHNLIQVYGEEGGEHAQWGLVVEGSATNPLNVGGKYGAALSNRIVNSLFNRPKTYVADANRGTILVRGHVQNLSVEARVVNASQLQPPTGEPFYPTVRMTSWQIPASGAAPYPTLVRIEGVDDKDFGDDAPVFDLAEGTRAVQVRSYWFKKGRWMVAGEVKALTAGYTVKPVESGFGFSNPGAGAPVTATLPAANPGHEFQFFSVAPGQVLRMDPASGEAIRGGGAGKYLELASGSTATLKCVVAGVWEIASLVGASSFEP